MRKKDKCWEFCEYNENEAQQLYAVQVKQLYKHLYIALIGTVVNSLLLIFILWNLISQSVLISWFAAMLAVSLLRCLLYFRFQRSSQTPAEIVRWDIRFIVCMALSGMVWGSAGIILFPVDSVTHQIFIAFVLGGMVAGSAGTFSVIINAFLAFSLPTFFPIIIRFFVIGDEIHLTMGGMLLLFWLLMFFTAKQINNVTISSLKLQFENRDLIRHITAEKTHIEKLNENYLSEIAERKQAEEALQRARDELEMRVQQRTADLAKINEALEAEVIEHKRTAEELRKYKENLEQIVQERTSELEEAQKELINKAMEAGRAQLSAMVLHNIGNAITPVNVQVEEMRLGELERICHYFENIYLDLYEHAQDLHQQAQNNPRVEEVFAFMGNLVEALKAFTTQQAVNANKIVQTVSYISEILALQQAYAARNHETKERIDLNMLIEDSIRMQKDALKKRGITLKRDLDQSQPKLVIDKNRLMQVLINLIMNSYDAIDELDDHSAEKVIHINTFSNGGGVGFKITDSGIGIEPDSIDTLFEFGKSNKGSSGFGLYYCKIFVESNQGVFKLSSPGRGRGATAEIRFEALK